MKIFKTECLLYSQLPNIHACSSAAEEFCPNPLLWVVISEKTCKKLIFQLFCVIWLYFSPTKRVNFMMKYYFDFLRTKFELATPNNN